MNHGFAVCESYPELVYVPKCLDRGTLLATAKFRAQNRLPVLTYHYNKRGNSIVRCVFVLLLR